MPKIPELDDRGRHYNSPGESINPSPWMIYCMKLAIKTGTAPFEVLKSFLRHQGGLRNQVIESYKRALEEIDREK